MLIDTFSQPDYAARAVSAGGLKRRIAVVFTLGVTALVAGSDLAGGTTSRRTLALPSGTLVFFQGTSTQCLLFGPIAKIKGKRGVACFKGPPRQRAGGTRWIISTPTSIWSADSSIDEWKVATSNTTIRGTRTMSLNTSFTFAGLRYTTKGRSAELGCRFQVIRGSPDPGGKAVICADLVGGGPVRGSDGFVITQRAVGVVEFRSSDGSAKVSPTWRQRPCKCDK